MNLHMCKIEQYLPSSSDLESIVVCDEEEVNPLSIESVNFFDDVVVDIGDSR